ncbi:MAG: hypothetical protein JOZ36_08955 [Acidobacteria bacterium]|nr:hypothetical protein [Acidobacteriota bacterium]
MKQICSARIVVRTALLVASSAAGLMAQSEMASNSMPHGTIPFTPLPSQTDQGSIGNSSSNVASDTFTTALIPKLDLSSRPSLVPGTLATVSSSTLKTSHKSGFSVEPDYLPSWVTNQPLAYLQYGAAPAVVTLHFGHK